MRNLFILLLLSNICTISSQEIDENILLPVLDDVERFAKDYFTPASEAMVYSLSSGWTNTAKSKELWEFEVGLNTNFAFVSSSDQKFLLDTNNYNTVSFESGAVSENIATALGQNNPKIPVILNIVNPETGGVAEVSLNSPQGVGSNNTDFVQSGFLQASVGLGKGFEFKARFLPKVTVKDVDANFFGFGVQNEITNWLKLKENFPLDISAFAGFSRFNGKYNLNSSEDISDLTGKIESEVNSWLFSTNFSTKLKNINFYGSIGYVVGNGETTTSANGLFSLERSSGTLEAEIFVEPFTVESKTSGVRGVIGSFYEYRSFLINLDYAFQKFGTASLGISYKFKV